MNLFQVLGIGAAAAAGLALVARATGARPPPPCPEVLGPIAFRQQGARAAAPTLIVIHCTDEPSHPGMAMSTANYFASPTAGGSAHLVVDSAPTLVRCLSDNIVPVGAASDSHDSANKRGLHIEFCGQARFTRAQWLAMDAELSCGAAAIGAWARHYGIPITLLSAVALRDGAIGVTTHAALTAAFGITGASAHLDPGPGFPIDVVLARARAARG